jgi:hypothetical protein
MYSLALEVLSCQGCVSVPLQHQTIGARRRTGCGGWAYHRNAPRPILRNATHTLPLYPEYSLSHSQSNHPSKQIEESGCGMSSGVVGICHEDHHTNPSHAGLRETGPTLACFASIFGANSGSATELEDVQVRVRACVCTRRVRCVYMCTCVRVCVDPRLFNTSARR